MASAVKRGDSYKITVSLGFDVNGQHIRKYKTWTPDPGMTPKQEAKELENQKRIFEQRCRNGEVLDGSIRFADFAQIWFENYADKQLRAKTVARYKSMMPRINAAIGHIHLDKIQPHHLMIFYDNLGAPGMRDDTSFRCLVDFKALLKEIKLTKTAFASMAGVSISVLNSITSGKNITLSSAEKVCETLDVKLDQLFQPVEENKTLSAKTILHHHRLISSILATAVYWQIIPSNPCERVKPPKVEKSEPRYLDEKEAAYMLELLEDEDIQYRTAIQLLLYTGFRRGELLGLEWSDINFENQIIHVRRTSLYLPEKGIFEDDTKNTTSERVIKVSSTAFEMLREYKVWQLEQRLKLGDQWHQTDRLFTAWDGTPMHPDNLTSWFHDFVERNDLPSISIHSLRHTNATLLIANHMPITTVASRLGHANATTTSKIYAHAIRSADAAAAETLDNILAPGSKKSRGKLG